MIDIKEAAEDLATGVEQVVYGYISDSYCSHCHTYLRGREDPRHTNCTIRELQEAVLEYRKAVNT